MVGHGGLAMVHMGQDADVPDALLFQGIGPSELKPLQEQHHGYALTVAHHQGWDAAHDIPIPCYTVQVHIARAAEAPMSQDRRHDGRSHGGGS